MAKMQALEAVNEVLKRIGESTIAALSSLTTIQQVAFDALNQALEEIAQDVDFKPLEAAGTATLATGTSTYAYPNDYRSLAIDSMRQVDDKSNIMPLTADEWDLMFPEGIQSALRQGYPERMADMFGVLNFDKVPTAAENGKTVLYRYFKIPTLYSTATETGTSWIPEGYDRTLLVDYASWLTMKYLGHPEANEKYLAVFGSGDNKHPEGHLSKFKRKFTQPELKPRVTFHF